jgi:hypothetical protein
MTTSSLLGRHTLYALNTEHWRTTRRLSLTACSWSSWSRVSSVALRACNSVVVPEAEIVAIDIYETELG